MIYHKHLLINAQINNPMKSEDEAVIFLNNLVKAIDMKILKGPFASYVDKQDNRGLTALVMIETSHIAFHIWDEQSPSLLQFDLYTCGQLQLDKVFEILKETFSIVSCEYQLIDRADGFNLEQSGTL